MRLPPLPFELMRTSASHATGSLCKITFPVLEWATRLSGPVARAFQPACQILALAARASSGLASGLCFSTVRAQELVSPSGSSKRTMRAPFYRVAQPCQQVFLGFFRLP